MYSRMFVGIDPPVVPQGDADLMFVKGDLIVAGDLFLGLRVDVEQALHDLPFDQGLGNDLRRVLLRDPLVEDILG